MELDIKKIADEIIQSIETETGQDTPPQQKSYNRILAHAMAGQILQNRLHILQTTKDLFPETATTENLDAWASFLNLSRVEEATTTAEINITLTGSVTIPVGTIFTRNSQTYRTETIAQLTTGTAQHLINIIASNSGSATALAIGDVLTLQSPIVGAENEATVTAVVTQGADRETDEQLRVRILESLRTFSAIGGTLWHARLVETLPAIKRCFPYSSATQVGQTRLFVELEADEIGLTQQIVNDINAIFNREENTFLWARAVTFTRYVIEEVTRVAFNFTVVDLQDATTETETIIEERIEEYILSRICFVPGLSLQRTDTISRNDVIGIVSNVIQEFNLNATFTTVNMTIDNNAVEETFYYLDRGQIASVGTITI